MRAARGLTAFAGLALFCSAVVMPSVLLAAVVAVLGTAMGVTAAWSDA